MCFSPANFTIELYYEIATEFRQKSPKTLRNDGLNFAMTIAVVQRHCEDKCLPVKGFEPKLLSMFRSNLIVKFLPLLLLHHLIYNCNVP